MTGCQAIIAALESTKATLEQFVADFTDTDLLVRPVPNANHAAWQIGNVIVGDIVIIKPELPAAMFPELPTGFMDLHGPKGAKLDTDPGFLSKDEYLKLFAATRSAAITAVTQLTDADLDRPTSENMRWAGPTLGHVLLMAANHTLMHAGQFSVIRRKLGKPVLF